jgi:hypothetical protein
VLHPDGGLRLHSSLAKEVAPPNIHEGGQTGAATTKPLSASPLLTADVVDKLYRQLVEIQAITTAQLAEYTRWRRSDLTTIPVWAGAGRQKPTMTPSVAVLALLTLQISRPQYLPSTTHH